MMINILIINLTNIMIETISFNTDSISLSFPSLKHASHTPIILCKSSSMPLGDFSSLISAPRLLKYTLSSCA